MSKTYNVITDKTNPDEERVVEISETKQTTDTSKTTIKDINERIKNNKVRIKQLVENINEDISQIDVINTNTDLDVTVPNKITVEQETPEKVNLVE